MRAVPDPLKLLMWKMDTCQGPRDSGYQILWDAYKYLKYGIEAKGDGFRRETKEWLDENFGEKAESAAPVEVPDFGGLKECEDTEVENETPRNVPTDDEEWRTWFVN
jgi:hypothetical protein